MKNEEEFQKNVQQITAIPKENTIAPPFPVEFIVDEALDLSVNATEDKAALVAVGLDENLINTLASRAVSLRYAEMVWNAEAGKRKEATKEWNAAKNDVMKFKNEMIHDFNFAYRNDANLSQKMREIAEGNSFPDMVQDLGNMAVLGRNNPAPLQLIRYDMAKINTADVLSVRMGDLLAQVNGEKDNNSADKLVRDQAFTYLNEAVSTIREYGKYVFWKDEKKLKNYTSDYTRKHRKTDTETGTEENNAN